MADDRRLKVLSAIVTDYVRTRESVGLRALVERYRLGVSPATIRNDMAVLEDEGYIHQPHTSAGRVPTEKGYRLFVDQIARIKPLSAPERAAITTLLTGEADLEQVVARAVRVLARLTGQLAVLLPMSISSSKLGSRPNSCLTVCVSRKLEYRMGRPGRSRRRTPSRRLGLAPRVTSSIASRYSRSQTYPFRLQG